MSDLIKREDAIKAINKALDRETLLYGLVRKIAVDALRSTPSADRPQVSAELRADFLKRQYEATLEENKRLVVGKWQAEQVLQTIIQQLEYVLEHGAVDEDGTHPITVENVLACIRAWMKGADNETAND